MLGARAARRAALPAAAAARRCRRRCRTSTRPPFGTLPGRRTLAARVAGRVEHALAAATAACSSARTLQGAAARRSTGASRRTGASRSASSRSTTSRRSRTQHGCTVNDVVVSICAGAVRRWLIEHDELPDEPLVAQIPVSVRTDEQAGTYGNRIMLMSAPLFTNARTRSSACCRRTRRCAR